MKVFYTIIVTCLSLFVFQTDQQTTKDKIIGHWVLEGNTFSDRFTFKSNGKCLEYSDGVLVKTYSYSISNISCGGQTPDAGSEFLKFVNDNDSEDQFCYFIHGISTMNQETYLSIERKGNPIPILYKKHLEPIQEVGTIVGTWVKRVDENNLDYRWEFTEDGECTIYWNAKSFTRYDYKISRTTPQCGFDVPIAKQGKGPDYSYLELKNPKDPDDKFCYEITGLTDQYMGLSLIGGASMRNIVFVKQ